MAPTTPVTSFNGADCSLSKLFRVVVCGSAASVFILANQQSVGIKVLQGLISVPSDGAGPGIGTCLDPEAKITRLRVQATPCWAHLEESFLLEGIVVALSG